MKRLVITAILILLGTPSWAMAADRKISNADGDVLARALVEAADPDVKKLPGFGFDGESQDSRFPHLQFFSAWSNAIEGVIGFYALDLYTGDGWDVTTCTEIKSRKLERLQQRIRRRIGLTDLRYRQIRIPTHSFCIE